jgi:hypothetical protein
VFEELLDEAEFVVGHALGFGASDELAVKAALDKAAQADFVFSTLIGHALIWLALVREATPFRREAGKGRQKGFHSRRVQLHEWGC